MFKDFSKIRVKIVVLFCPSDIYIVKLLYFGHLYKINKKIVLSMFKI